LSPPNRQLASHGDVGAQGMKLAIITHRWDIFHSLPDWHPRGPRPSAYLLHDILECWRAMGNHWLMTSPSRRLDADAAFLHVVPTVVAQEYRDLADSYPFTVNAGSWDITKRKVSLNLLDSGSDWTGPVIVKSDLNNFAKTEHLHNFRAHHAGEPPAHHDLPPPLDYEVYAKLGDVPGAVWRDRRLVVEKFLPEDNGDGTFSLRTWVFLGDRERCTRHIVPGSISKANDVIRSEPCEVPEAIREQRARLGFDYGKFDFVIFEGEPILLDANRTPGNPRNLQDHVKKGAQNLAEGLDALLRSR
jgi:hypothetical protein